MDIAVLDRDDDDDEDPGAVLAHEVAHYAAIRSLFPEAQPMLRDEAVVYTKPNTINLGDRRQVVAMAAVQLSGGRGEAAYRLARGLPMPLASACATDRSHLAEMCSRARLDPRKIETEAWALLDRLMPDGGD
jgi:hypothetical protein